MRIWRTRSVLLFLALVACAHHSPEEAMLQAFSVQSGDQIFDRDSQPEYLRFADPRTASVFRSLIRSGRYRVASGQASLLCPGVSGEGIHGYLLHARVDTTMGDSAYASLLMDCIRDPQRCPNRDQTCPTWYSGAVQIETEYLLVRKNGKWKVSKPVSGGIGVLM